MGSFAQSTFLLVEFLLNIVKKKFVLKKKKVSRKKMFFILLKLNYKNLSNNFDFSF